MDHEKSLGVGTESGYTRRNYWIHRSRESQTKKSIAEPHSSMVMIRYRSIDLLRTAAIFEMVVFHFVDFLSEIGKYYGFGGAGLFLVLSGVSYHIWLASQKRRRKDPLVIRRNAIRRGMSICAIGEAMGMAFFGVREIFYCDILVLNGMTQIFLASIFWEVPSAVLLVTCVVVVVCTPILQSVLRADEYYDLEHDAWCPDFKDLEAAEITLTDVFKFHLVAGYFPLFPYVAYPLVGLVVGRALIPNRTPSKEHQAARTLHDQPDRVAMRISAVGGAMHAAGISLAVVWDAFPSLQSHMYLGGLRVYLPTFPCILGKMGRALFLLGAAFHFIDGPSHDNINNKLVKRSKQAYWRYFEPISNRYGKATLTIYIMHYAVIFWPMRIAGWLTNKQNWYNEYVSRVCEPWQAAILGVLFFSLMYPLIGWTDHHRIPRLEDVVRRYMS